MSDRHAEIVLSRHGKPDLPHPLPRIAGTELADWERRYNETGIGSDVAAPAGLHELAARCDCIVASDLKRSVESAARLAAGREIRVEPMLREACLPGSIGLAVRLPPRAWAAVGRIAWFLGVGASAENIAATRLRARRVARQLQSLSDQHGLVLVVGHGTFNRFVAASLRRLGWRGPRVLPVSYWSTARFTRSMESDPTRLDRGRPR